MKSPEIWLAQIMSDMGSDALIPSTEDANKSIWITEDDAPGEIAGYYEKRRIPLTHRFLKDGRTFVFDFERGTAKYRIRSGKAETIEANARRVAEVVGTLFQWIDDGIVAWNDAFAGFAQASNEWWRVLRAPPDATLAEIERAYRRQARVVHPDAGGDAESFRKLRVAYEQALTFCD